MILPILLLLWLAVLSYGIVMIARRNDPERGRTIISIALFSALFFAAYSGWIMLTALEAKPIYIVLEAFLGVLVIATALLCVWGKLRRKALALTFAALYIACFSAAGHFIGLDIYEANLPVMRDSGESLLKEYRPYGVDTKVAVLDEPCTLTLSENLPVLDGATALYPVYSAFARAVYPAEKLSDDRLYANDLLRCSRTDVAYQSLVDGEVDIIFVAQPSEDQLAYAAEKGVEMVLTPMGREAFVFFVNAQNPIDSLTIKELQGIYSGEIRLWNELGPALGEIIAFQRSKGSGSQTALQAFMGDVPLVAPPSEHIEDDMVGIIEVIADYKNYKNALGFSFRFYSTEMVKNRQIRLLSINGVPPTPENIRSSAYPITSTLYAVTLAGNENPNVQAFVDWVISPQGQALIEATGYVGN